MTECQHPPAPLLSDPRAGEMFSDTHGQRSLRLGETGEAGKQPQAESTFPKLNSGNWSLRGSTCLRRSVVLALELSLCPCS